MDEGPSHAQGREYQQRTNGTGGDTPTGYRPCPFCHSVIPWESEQCPSCGRVLIERMESGLSRTSSTVSGRAGFTSPWSSGIRPVLMHVRNALVPAWHRLRTGTVSAPSDPWATTSRGTSWSVFQSVQRRARSWRLGSFPTPTERERRVLLIASIVMVVVFLIALIVR
jgi:hypothetical protein